MNEYYSLMYDDDYLEHFGVKGMHWGIRRYQNKDGTLTKLGKQYRVDAYYVGKRRGKRLSRMNKLTSKIESSNQKRSNDKINKYKKLRKESTGQNNKDKYSKKILSKQDSIRRSKSRMNKSNAKTSTYLKNFGKEYNNKYVTSLLKNDSKLERAKKWFGRSYGTSTNRRARRRTYNEYVDRMIRDDIRGR